MKKADRYLQMVRINKAVPFIKNGDDVLDIGCGDGPLFKQLRKLGMTFTGIGYDPEIREELKDANYQLIRDKFPDSSIKGRRFNIITALAVLEHIPESQLGQFIRECNIYLKEGGLAVITVPSPLVDRILKILMGMRVLDGMEVDQHHGYDTNLTIPLFQQNGFALVKYKKFQLGLNNLFVFRKTIDKNA